MTLITIRDKSGAVMGTINEATGETTVTEAWKAKTPEKKETTEDTEDTKEDGRE